MKKVIIIFLIFFSCQSKNNVVEKICESVLKSKNILDIKECTNFEWDKGFVFSHRVSQEYISRIIGTDYKTTTQGDSNFSSLIIFMNNNKVVYDLGYRHSDTNSIYFFACKDDYVTFNRDSKFIICNQEDRKNFVLIDVDCYSKFDSGYWKKVYQITAGTGSSKKQ
jgi:hypothetical protein